MSECTHDCSTCTAQCASKNKPESLLVQQNEDSHVKHIIAVHSGKGGVGKSLVTSLLAKEMTQKGYKCAILDADITGPSIPKMFGIGNIDIVGNENNRMIPPYTKSGIEVMSINLLMEDPNAPVVWRGSLLGGCVKQFWTDTAWNEVDYMFVDMPPGTGDIPLTIFQSLPVEGIICVTTPQELVSMIVGKAVSMARMMNVPILGMVENYSYYECDECHTKLHVFGESHIEEVSREYSIPVLSQLPIDPKIAQLCDAGAIEDLEKQYLDGCVTVLEHLGEKS